MTDYIKDAEYEIGMIISAIVESQHYKNPDSQFYDVHIPYIMSVLNDIPTQAIGINRLKFLLGSDDLIQKANTATSWGGVASTAYSVSCIIKTRNPFARWFYIVGGGCSFVGTSLSAYAALTGNVNTCSYSFAGLFATGSGTIITCIGKTCMEAGDLIEGKRKKKRLPGRYFGNRVDIAFTLPHYIEKIPYGKIFTGTMFVITVYGYGKFILASYRQGQQFIFNFESRRRSKLIQKQAKYLVNSFSFVLAPSNKCSRIYQLAVTP